MDCILNELSLNGQYKDIDDFEKSGVKPLSAVLHDMSVLGIDLLYKKSDFYNSNVTSNETFYSIIFSRAAKVNDSMRRMKSQLAKLQNEPFWDEDVQHDVTKIYLLVRKGSDDTEVTLTSVAEAQARRACLISFAKSEFLSDEFDVKIKEDNTTDSVPNVWEGGQLGETLLQRGDISFESYCSNIRFSKLNFDSLDAKNGFNLVSSENIGLFKSAFNKFESLSWQQIVTDDGLDYKEFSKNKKTGTYFSDDEWRAGVHKFRIDQKIRCFGNTINGVFYVLRFELDHKLSDLG